MRKKGLLLVIALLLVFGLVACNTTTTTTTTTSGTTTTTTTTGTTTSTTTTTTGTTTTTQSTTAFSITLSGLDDAGFTPEDKIIAGDLFNLLDGVHAMGSDGVDYVDDIVLQAAPAACQIDSENNLFATTATTCIVTYTAVVNMKIARADRNIKISAAPIVMEFTETDLIDNVALFGTDYEATTTKGAANSWYYWTASAAVLGETGSIAVNGGKLIIDQEDLGGVNYGCQSLNETTVPLNKGQYYKLTMTITSDVDTIIDFVTKAFNNDYANDTHSEIDVKVGTFDYEIVFKAAQDILYFNIMTGVVQAIGSNPGRLEFSNFTLWEGPIVYEYEELLNFFDNDAIAVGTAVGPIPTGGTDSDFVRNFYYWINDGEIAVEYVEDGIEVEIVTGSAVDYGIQLQYNDMLKAYYTLKTGAHYKLSMNVNASSARTMEVNVTGDHYSKPTSVTQRFDLAVGDNTIVVEFASLYDYFFMKLNFGNYGDLEQTGVFTITNLQLFEEKGAVGPEDPVDEGEVIGNDFGVPSNLAGDLPIENNNIGEIFVPVPADTIPIPANTFYLWYGQAATGWFGSWTEFPIVTGTYGDGKVNLDIQNTGSNEFWGIQLKYLGGEIKQTLTYNLSFDLYSSVVRGMKLEVKNGSAAYASLDVVLQVGMNHIELEFVAQSAVLSLQFNLGKFSTEYEEEGTLEFSNFMLSRPTQEMVGYIVNGDFATDQAFAGADADGWAYWSTQGIPDAWALPNYNGTATIAGGVMTAITTQTGGAVWGNQLQYNHVGADLIVGAVYRVEFDVNSDIDTTICVELKYDDNSKNKDITVAIKAGDNHIILYYVATQARFRMFVMLGFTAPSTLVFDNFQLFEPIMPDPVEPEEEFLAIVPDGIFNGDFEAVDFAVNGVGSGWTSWTTVGESAWTKAIDATFTPTDGAVVINIIDDATNHGIGDHVWSIQFGYKPGALAADVIPGKVYVVEFDVNATVAGQFSMEMSTTDNVANYAELIDLVAGDNHVVFEFTAYQAGLMLTLCIGKYGPATLTIDNFVLSGYFAPEEIKEVSVPIENGIFNGDFEAVDFAVNGVGSGWTSWTTVGESAWTKAIDATFTPTDGAVVINIIDDATNHGIGDHVWSIQFGYKPGASGLAVIPGKVYTVEFDVNATVAGQFSMEMSTTDNVANYAELIDLVAGDNHVVFEFTAYQAGLMLTLCIGKYGPATLTVDNFVLNETVSVLRTWEQFENGIFNGDFEAVDFAVNGVGSGWTSWTTVGESAWTKAIDATFTHTDGAVVINIIDDATNHGIGDHVWSIQLGYKPGAAGLEVVPGQLYRVEFDVNATVAGQFSMEMSTTDNVANYAELIDLVAGDNHVVFEFTAYQAGLMLTLCIGKYGPATLIVDNFILSTK